jgi:hypothetical protein
MATQRTLFLNTDKWDIELNSNGDLKLVKSPYADAQNVANAIRLFTRDAFLAQNKGVPHFELDLGRMPAFSAVRSVYRKNARAVENIRDAVIQNLRVDNDTRALTGIIIATTEDGQNVSVEI